MSFDTALSAQPVGSGPVATANDDPLTAPPSPLVSVVIPCHRHLAQLPEALASVLSQSIPVEVIVVDDGSPEDLRDVVAGWPTVRLLERPRAGVSAARNAGLDACRGEYVLFLDADDHLLPGALRAGLQCLSGHPSAGYAFGRYRFIREDGSYGGEPGMPPPRRPTYLELVRRNYIGMLGTVLFRTDVVRELGGFRCGLVVAEDYDLLLRAARTHPVIGHEVLVAEYRRYATSASADAERMLAGVLGVLADERAAAPPDDEVQRAFDDGERFFKLFYGVRLTRQILREGLMRGSVGRAGCWARQLVRHLGPEVVCISLPPALVIAVFRKTWWIARGWWHRRVTAPLTREAL